MSTIAFERLKGTDRETNVKLTDDIEAHKREILNALERRAYEIFEARGRASGRELDDWLQAESELLCPLKLEVRETQNALILRGQLTGFGADEFEIKIQRNALIIAGQKKPASSPKGSGPAGPHAKRIYRRLELPVPVVRERVTANFREGVLDVILPKETRKLEVKSMAAVA